MEYHWSNKATIPVLKILYATTQADVPVQGKSIIIATGRRRDEQLAEMTVYEALKELNNRNYVKQVEGRYLLTEKGEEVVDNEFIE